ncbi:expressed unknown protein [Seminavis robusta]|uniref:Uncharacterized protein n=1 Tax=Seminavis robusta TaxID=568900 RepID=A0A9N8HUA1_9STRA|nr:expressed unknown protein [Seminavis robusta]|eukprot:Sro1783_g297270.1 n/a (153) ;mRNA; f:17235-17693
MEPTCYSVGGIFDDGSSVSSLTTVPVSNRSKVTPETCRMAQVAGSHHPSIFSDITASDDSEALDPDLLAEVERQAEQARRQVEQARKQAEQALRKQVEQARKHAKKKQRKRNLERAKQAEHEDQKKPTKRRRDDEDDEDGNEGGGKPALSAK